MQPTFFIITLITLTLMSSWQQKYIMTGNRQTLLGNKNNIIGFSHLVQDGWADWATAPCLRSRRSERGSASGASGACATGRTATPASWRRRRRWSKRRRAAPSSPRPGTFSLRPEGEESAARSHFRRRRHLWEGRTGRPRPSPTPERFPVTVREA